MMDRVVAQAEQQDAMMERMKQNLERINEALPDNLREILERYKAQAVLDVKAGKEVEGKP